jgi:hypothetical protein
MYGGYQICPRFGLDEELWEPVGESREELDRNKRRVRVNVTTTLEGLELRVWLQETQYGGRAPERRLLETEAEFRAMLAAHPSGLSQVVQRAVHELVQQAAEPRDDHDKQCALHALW